MTRGIGLVLSAAAAFGHADPRQGEYDPWAQRREKRKPIVFREPALATFTSDLPLTKRQRRRMRGKGKSQPSETTRRNSQTTPSQPWMPNHDQAMDQGTDLPPQLAAQPICQYPDRREPRGFLHQMREVEAMTSKTNSALIEAERKHMLAAYFTTQIQDAAGGSTITRQPITGPDWPVRSNYPNRQQFRAACAAWRAKP